MTPTTDIHLLRHAAIEAAMRLTDDDTLVFPFRDAAPASIDAQAALGRLLSTAPVRLTPGSPLCVFAVGGELDPQWRTHAVTVDASLWGTYEFLATLYLDAPDDTVDPYERLTRLVAISDDDLTN